MRVDFLGFFFFFFSSRRRHTRWTGDWSSDVCSSDLADGAVYVVFYDRRGDPKNRQQIVALARSTDDGRTFRNYAWMDQPFDAQGVFMGDYNGIAVLNGRVYGVWTQKPENKSSRDTLIQVGVADFNTEKTATAAPQPAQE